VLAPTILPLPLPILDTLVSQPPPPILPHSNYTVYTCSLLLHRAVAMLEAG